jgi:hypothetical protein
MREFGLSGNLVDRGRRAELNYQLFHCNKFTMPTAALEGHVIVDYGLQLGHARYKIAKDAM